MEIQYFGPFWQATRGDNNTKLSKCMKGTYNYNSWETCRGMNKEEAMKFFIK